MLYFMIFIGAGLGGLLRVLVSDGIKTLLHTTFPYATLLVNISGCFLMGLLVATLLERPFSSTYYFREILAIGFLGGYTTFSTFSIEALELIMKQQWYSMAVYLSGHYILTLGCCALGYCLGKQFT